MAFQPVAINKTPTIKRISVKNWLKGVVTAYDDGRTPTDGLRSSGNVILQQDGTVRPRPSLVLYGPQPTGTILGEIYEFTVQSGLTKTYWLISMQNVAGVTNVYIAKGEDTSWTLCSGKTYDNTARAHFCQTQSKVLVMNGVDTLSYLNTATSTVVGYTALSTPTAPTLTANTGLVGTPYNVYYAISANSSVGESIGSSVLTQPVLIARDFWNPSTQSIQISWAAVTNAKSYNVYAGVSSDGAGQPTMYLIAGGLDAAILTYTDNGSAAQDLTRILPTTNSTAGPKTSRGTVINSRVWMVGDADNPSYVWRGGDFGYELDFSPSNGGGFSPIGKGTKEIPIYVGSFRDGKGTSTVTVLSQGSNGKGTRSLLSPTSITHGATTFIVWEIIEDSGKDGTDSPDGVINYQNSLWYPSRDGFKTTGTKPQLQNVLSTDRISNTIQPDISTLNNASMNLCNGVAFEGRLYWSLPVGSSTNSQIWALDLDRGGAWMKPWNISADWMVLYNDNSGNTHHIVLSGNKIYELSYVALTADNGVAVPTSGNSGQITFSEDGRVWGRLMSLTFVLLRPQGSLSFNVSGRTEDSNLAVVGTGLFISTSLQAGWSEPGAGWSSLRGWSQIVTVPAVFNSATQEVYIDIDEDVQWYQYGWNSTDTGVDYNLSDVIASYVEIGVKDLS